MRDYAVHCNLYFVLFVRFLCLLHCLHPNISISYFHQLVIVFVPISFVKSDSFLFDCFFFPVLSVTLFPNLYERQYLFYLIIHCTTLIHFKIETS